MSEDPRKGEDGAAVDAWTQAGDISRPWVATWHAWGRLTRAEQDVFALLVYSDALAWRAPGPIPTPRRTLARALRALASWCDRVALRILR